MPAQTPTRPLRAVSSRRSIFGQNPKRRTPRRSGSDHAKSSARAHDPHECTNAQARSRGFISKRTRPAPRGKNKRRREPCRKKASGLSRRWREARATSQGKQESIHLFVWFLGKLRRGDRLSTAHVFNMWRSLSVRLVKRETFLFSPRQTTTVPVLVLVPGKYK